MAITGSVDLGKRKCAVTVDHDPRTVATDVPKGSLIIDANGDVFTKMDDGATTHVNRCAPTINVQTGGNTAPYWETENAAYETVAAFAYPGMECSCKPACAKFVVETTGGAQVDMRIQDVTNTQTVAELTGQTGTGPTIKVDSLLVNLPAAEAVFEVQIKKSAGAGGDKVRIYSATLEA